MFCLEFFNPIRSFHYSNTLANKTSYEETYGNQNEVLPMFTGVIPAINAAVL